jgi:hypothetical protein
MEFHGISLRDKVGKALCPSHHCTVRRYFIKDLEAGMLTDFAFCSPPPLICVMQDMQCFSVASSCHSLSNCTCFAYLVAKSSCCDSRFYCRQSRLSRMATTTTTTVNSQQQQVGIFLAMTTFPEKKKT